MSQKKDFLLKKGLTEEEVQEAIRQANVQEKPRTSWWSILSAAASLVGAGVFVGELLGQLLGIAVGLRVVVGA